MSKKWLRYLVLGILFAGTALSLFFFKSEFKIESISQIVNQAGIFAPLIYISIYILATVFFLPGSVLTLAGGFLFGPILGTFYSMLGAVIGATLAFWIARYISSDWVNRKIGKKLKWLLQGIEQSGWKFVAVVRLIPAIPFNLLNYALGLTPISTTAYVVASTIFMLPGCFAYTYLGYLGEAVLSEKQSFVQAILWAIAIFVLLSLIPWMVKHVKAFRTQALKELEKDDVKS